MTSDRFFLIPGGPQKFAGPYAQGVLDPVFDVLFNRFCIEISPMAAEIGGEGKRHKAQDTKHTGQAIAMVAHYHRDGNALPSRW